MFNPYLDGWLLDEHLQEFKSKSRWARIWYAVSDRIYWMIRGIYEFNWGFALLFVVFGCITFVWLYLIKWKLDLMFAAF